MFHGEDGPLPASGAWARAEITSEGLATISEGGGLALWEAYSDLLKAWEEAGRPEINRYGLTITPEGAHHLWRDRPDSPRIPLDPDPVPGQR